MKTSEPDLLSTASVVPPSNPPLPTPLAIGEIPRNSVYRDWTAARSKE